MTVAYEDANSKFVNVVSVVCIYSEEHVDDGLDKILKLKFCRDFEVKFLVKMLS